MKNIAVILSGCGYLDGAEIRESVLTLLALDQTGACSHIYAPDVDQHHVINHLSGEEVKIETRNVLTESARIARGSVKDIKELDMKTVDAIVVPGGFGVAKNLSSLALKGPDGEINKSFKNVLQEAITLKIPIGAICISPAVICLALGSKSPEVTIGEDEGTAGAIESMGGIHIKTYANEIHIDEKNKIVSTPAYMYDDASISDVYEGISKCVKKVIDLS